LSHAIVLQFNERLGVNTLCIYTSTGYALIYLIEVVPFMIQNTYTTLNVIIYFVRFC